MNSTKTGNNNIMKAKQYKGVDQRPLRIKDEFVNRTVTFKHPRLGEIKYDTSLLGEDQETYQVFYKNGWEFLFTTANESANKSLVNPPLSGTKDPENGQGSEQKLT